MTNAVAYGATLAVFAIVDLIWLGLIAKTYYNRELAKLLAPAYDIKAAIAFYLIYPVGIVVFAVAPSLASGKLTDAGIWGGLFGFFAYATYDLTNLATLRDWPLKLSIIDIAWGTAHTAATAICAHVIVRTIGL